MNDESRDMQSPSEWSDEGSGWQPVESGADQAADSDAPAAGRATAALVLGIIGLVFVVMNGCCCGVSSGIGLVLSIVALILGIQESKAIENGESSAAGAGMAKAGKILGLVGLVLHLLAILVAIVYIVFVVGFQTYQQGAMRNF